ncbi:MAG: MMPL family transporter [Piscirickettsiaceae bacterium]|nr:MMPL family transporter [Piscirickettsiaceae bacterium]
MKESITGRYANFVVTHPWRILLLTLLVVLFAGSGGRFIEFTNDYRVFFSDDNPELQAFEAMQNIYTKTDNVLFVVAPENGKVFSAETLALVAELTELSWQTPYSTRVDSVTNFQHTVAEEDDLLVGDLVDDVAQMSIEEVQYVRDVALNEPLLLNRLISPSAHVTGVNITIQLPGKSLTEVPEVAEFARQLAADIEAKYPKHRLYITGLAMMNNAFGESTQNDMATLVPMMFLTIIFILGILLRSFSSTIAAVVMIFATILFAMGIMGWLGWKLTPASAAAPTIIMTMAVADTVHLLVTFLHNMRRGQTRHDAMKDSLRVNFQPIFITSVTTAIGFLSMNFSDVPPFHDLGNVVAIGVMFAFVLSVSTLPAIMMVLPVRVLAQAEKENAFMPAFAQFVIHRRRPLLFGMGLLALALMAFLPQNTLDDQFVEYFDETVDFRRDTDFSRANLAGIYTLQYSLKQGESGGISDPVFLKSVDQFSQWLRTQPEVMHVQTISDTFKRLNKNMHGDDPAYYSLPESRELAAQYLLLYELSLPYGLDLNDQIDIDKAQTRLNITLENLHTEEMLALENRVSNWLSTNLPDVGFTGASPTLMFAHIGERNVSSMLFGTTLALILISLILVLALRSAPIGLISLAPNLIPAGMAFGLWGLLVGQVGLSLSVVAGMTLGIVVDDTVHFLSKYLRARREKGLNEQEAVAYAFNTVGVALWVTSLVLVLGFVVLSQSHFALNSDMGAMAAITIAIALIMDFLFLPPLLMKLEEDSNV